MVRYSLEMLMVQSVTLVCIDDITMVAANSESRTSALTKHLTPCMTLFHIVLNGTEIDHVINEL